MSACWRSPRRTGCNAGWTAAQRARERGVVACPLPCRAPARRRPAPLRHRHSDRRPSGDAGLARRRRRTSRALARRRAFRPDRLDPRPLPPLTASTRMRSWRRPRASLRDGRCGMCGGWGSARSGALSPAAYCSGAQPIGPDGPAVLGRPPPNRLIPPPRLERRKRSRWRIPIAFRSERSMCWLGLRAFTAA